MKALVKIKEFYQKIKILLDILDSIEYIDQSEDKKSIRIKIRKNLVIESENYAFLTNGMGVHETEQFHMNPNLKNSHYSLIYKNDFNQLDEELEQERLKQERLKQLEFKYIDNLKIQDKLYEETFSNKQ